MKLKFILFKRRLLALHLVLTKRHYLVITHTPDQAGDLLPDGYVHNLTMDMVIRVTGLIHEHTQAMQQIEHQAGDILQWARARSHHLKRQ